MSGLCPCDGECHHDTSPCSVGCWSAQKPWRPEESYLRALDDVVREVGLLQPAGRSPESYDVMTRAGAFRDVLEAIKRLRATR